MLLPLPRTRAECSLIIHSAEKDICCNRPSVQDLYRLHSVKAESHTVRPASTHVNLIYKARNLTNMHLYPPVDRLQWPPHMLECYLSPNLLDDFQSASFQPHTLNPCTYPGQFFCTFLFNFAALSSWKRFICSHTFVVSFSVFSLFFLDCWGVFHQLIQSKNLAYFDVSHRIICCDLL